MPFGLGYFSHNYGMKKIEEDEEGDSSE